MVKKLPLNGGNILIRNFIKKNQNPQTHRMINKKWNRPSNSTRYKDTAQKEAQKLAADYVKKSDAIYQKAIEAGIRVTDDEVAAEVESIKQSYHSDDLDEISKKQMEAIISSFRSEEDYWEYEREVYQTLLVSQKYVDTIKEDFFTSHPEASYADWSAYFEDWKNQLVSDQ